MAEAQIVPKSRNNDGIVRHKVAIITEGGFKANGFVDWEEDELIALLSGWSAESLNSDQASWLVLRTIPYEEIMPQGMGRYGAEILCVKRSQISAWAISPAAHKSDLTIVRPAMVIRE